MTPLTLASLTGEKVHDALFSLTDEIEMGHIELSRAADLVVVAPATADLMAKAANGLANDLASTALLATDKPVLMAPAMNVRMWLHAATQRNLTTLRADGIAFVGPDEGEMACGEFGPGRMAEPAAILAAIEAHFARMPPKPLAGKHVLITAGPTHEPIDPVRYIANRSSGKQGYALAEAARDAGARVTLVSGPVTLSSPQGIRTIRVETAREMDEAVEQALPAISRFSRRRSRIGAWPMNRARSARRMATPFRHCSSPRTRIFSRVSRAMLTSARASSWVSRRKREGSGARQGQIRPQGLRSAGGE